MPKRAGAITNELESEKGGLLTTYVKEGDMMKAIYLTAPNDFEYRDVPEPPIEPHTVRVKVARVGICGSDLKIFSGHNPFARLPLIPGHEFAGVITEVGPEAQAKMGERVAVRPLTSCNSCEYCAKGEVNHCASLGVLGVHRDGAFADEVIVPDHLLHRLPDDMGWDEAAVAEPVAVAVHNMRRGEVKPGARVLVLGAGTIGLLIALLAKVSGAGTVSITDLSDARLQLARHFGADETLNAKGLDLRAHAATHGEYDVVFDVVGNKRTLDDATYAVKPAGRIVLVGVPHEQFEEINVKNIFARELVLTASRMYEPVDFARALTLVAEGKVPVDKLVSLTLPLSEIGEGLRRLHTEPDQTIKVLLCP
jgi:L-iditol 2-dehydrogenase